jgi:membrane protease YdiL (CAAX protease family)
MTSITTEPLPPPPPRRGRPLVAWLVILAVIGLVLWRHQTAPPESEEEADAEIMQDRVAVGLHAIFGGQSQGMYESLATHQGKISWRRLFRLTVIASELEGREKADLELIDNVDNEELGKPTAEETRLLRILIRVYSRWELSDADQEELRQQLGWYGDLALTPEGSDPQQRQAVLAPAKRAAVTAILYGALLFLLGFIGLMLLVVMAVLWLTGSLRGGLQTGISHGGLYAETFAVYLVLFILLGLLLGRVFPAGDNWAPLRSGLAALVSLAALGWPVLRGIPWRQVRAEIGWTAGRRPALEPLLGVGTYASALPLVVVGLLLFMLITAIERRLGLSVPPPSHPIIGWVVHSGWWARVQLIIDACILAPLIEETMFRGVLYRHLREATRTARPALSVLASAIVSSAVFAVIHPQGIAYVPVLAALAFTFAVAREWRGTLIPSMVAHGLTNSMTMLLLLLAMG